jgi:dihydroorotase
MDMRGDLRVEDGVIREVVAAIDTPRAAPRGAEVRDLEGALLVPGLVDMHVHLREPGREDAETIATGSEAAVHGGFTDVLAMPNTTPVADTAETVAYVRAAGLRAARARVHPCGAITQGLLGETLAPAHELVRAGARALSDDGRPVERAEVMRRALEYARPLGIPVISHAEDLTLRGAGVMHEGLVSTALGLHGMPAVAEEVAVLRDIALARMTGGRLHVAHVSTSGAVRALRRARAEGLDVTAEVTPHHLVLTDGAVRGYDTHTKMNPPLRSESHREAVLDALRDGTIGVIATDHAPHALHDKDVEFDAAAFGVIGLETAVGVLLTRLVTPGHVDLATLVRALTDGPRQVLRLPAVRLAPGSPADLTAIDLGETWVVDPASFASLSRNTPFAGWTLTGRPVLTVVGGEVVFAARAVEAPSAA